MSGGVVDFGDMGSGVEGTGVLGSVVIGSGVVGSGMLGFGVMGFDGGGSGVITVVQGFSSTLVRILRQLFQSISYDIN